MAEHPIDLVHDAQRSLACVCSLLAEAELPPDQRGGLHLVDPGEFGALLRLISDQLDRALIGFETRKQA